MTQKDILDSFKQGKSTDEATINLLMSELGYSRPLAEETISIMKHGTDIWEYDPQTGESKPQPPQ